MKDKEDIGMKDISGEGAAALAQPEKYRNGNGVFWIIRWFRSTTSSIMDAETYLSGVSARALYGWSLPEVPPPKRILRPV
ncbi:hypothetical protein MUP77_18335 [Candidatus Bathyarchaeota archaeon]|nr:hypothetical protein [Candidatus Bathyarchaeota archaeon]